MTDQEMRDTIRQMLADWNMATDEQRAEALRIAAEGAERANAALNEAWEVFDRLSYGR